MAAQVLAHPSEAPDDFEQLRRARTKRERNALSERLFRILACAMQVPPALVEVDVAEKMRAQRGEHQRGVFRPPRGCDLGFADATMPVLFEKSAQRFPGTAGGQVRHCEPRDISCTETRCCFGFLLGEPCDLPQDETGARAGHVL